MITRFRWSPHCTTAVDRSHDCEFGRDYLDDSGCEGDGLATEYDWLRFFLDIHTNASFELSFAVHAYTGRSETRASVPDGPFRAS